MQSLKVLYDIIMPGYHLYSSTSLISFLENYHSVFVPEDPLSDSVCTIVQNIGLGEWLLRSLTSIRGGLMAYNHLMPEQAIRHFIKGFPAARREERAQKNLYQDGLKIVLYKTLEELLGSADKDFDMLRRYAGSDSGRLWQLTLALASSFHHYGMNSPNLVDSWSRSVPALLDNDSDRLNETWQRKIWQRMFHANAAYSHLSEILSSIEESDEKYDGESCRVILFGSSFLGERALRFFKRLSYSLDIHHFILLPGREKTELKIEYLHNNARLYTGFNAMIPILKPESIKVSPSREESGGSTLENLRRNLIQDEEFDRTPLNDGSLEIHDVSAGLRTVEVLKEGIIEALAKDESLAPSQIGILAPDINLYAPFIESVFPSWKDDGSPDADHLPYKLIGLPYQGETPMQAALDGLLELPGSHYSRNRILSLAGNPCFSASGGDDALLRQWHILCEILNIRWGSTAEHRRNENAVDEIRGSWAYGFERIIAGYFFDEEDVTDILPLAGLSDSMAEDAGLLMDILYRLEKQFRHLNKEKKSLRDWTTLIDSLVHQWLRPRSDSEFKHDDERELSRLKRVFRDLMALSEDVNDLSDFNNDCIPWNIFRSLLEESRSQEFQRKGYFDSRGISCGSLQACRAIPFRRIYVLGLDEGLWPMHEVQISFDLREALPRVIDLSLEASDRYALIEGILSASDHLSLFYTGRDPERGETLSPAGPLSELMDYLGPDAVDLVQHHPLKPKIRASALAASQETASLETASPDRPREAHPLPHEPKHENLHWQHLLRFLKNPVEYFYRNRIQASIGSSSSEASELDLIEADQLLWWRHRRDAISQEISLLEDAENFVSDYRRLLDLRADVIRSPFADLQAENWMADAKSLQEQLLNLREEGFMTNESFNCRFTEKISGRDSSRKMLELPGTKISLADGSSFTITGDVFALQELDKGIWALVDFVSSNNPSIRNDLSGWLAVLLLANSLGENRPREFRIFRLGKRRMKARRFYFDERDIPENAGGEHIIIKEHKRILNSLLKIFCSGRRIAVPMYPDLAENIHKDEGNNPEMEFQELFWRVWQRMINNSYSNYSTLRDCPWRQRFLKDDDIPMEETEEFYRSLYIDGALL